MQLDRDFGEQDEREGEDTVVVPVIMGEEEIEGDGEASVLPWQNEREEGSVPLRQVIN